MTGGDRGAERDAKRCLECGVELKDGVKYCDFCGTKVAFASAVPAPAGAGAGAEGRGRGGYAWVAFGCLAVGALVYLGGHFKGAEPPPVPSPGGGGGKRQAVARCEDSLRQRARPPFRVIAFRSTVVAEERGGYAVSGTVELQSTAGEVQRKRYFCRARADAGGAFVVEEDRIY